MTLTKYHVGDLIQLVDERNTFGIKNFYGININKEFMPTAANTEGLDESKYKVVRKNRFVFSGMQTGRDQCIRISMYSNDDPIIVSPAYTTFEISATNVVIPMYFFMYFLSKEKDRLGAFYSDGSIRTNLDWDRFCEIEIALPDIRTQQKYVDVYLSMVENQKAYERGLEDLKLVCDGYIEDLRRNVAYEEIGKYIELKKDKNKDDRISEVYGVSNTLKFITASSSVDTDKLTNYKSVNYEDIAYVPTTHMKIWAVAISNREKPFVVSPIYEVFGVKDKNKLCPEYLFLWLCRKETIRYAFYNSWGSARENFVYDDLCTIKMPIPDISIQNSIVNIYKCYIERKEINEKLKRQIKDICPILIKGAIEEGK